MEDRIRYSVSCVNRNGNRVLAMPSNRASNFWDSVEEAQRYLTEMLGSEENTERLTQIHGKQAQGTYRVDRFECYSFGEAKRVVLENV